MALESEDISHPLDISDIDVLILCGGLGTRFQSVHSDLPKGLALVGGQPLLDILVNDLIKFGFQRFIFCVGHLKDKIIQHFRPRGKKFIFSEEDTPLGTGGAIKNAEALVTRGHFLILNGDSLCRLNFREFCRIHFERQALLSMVLSQGRESKDYGNVELDDTEKILSFQEKQVSSTTGPCFISAGIYLMQKKGLTLMPSSFPFSLEYDFFPNLVKNHKCFGWVVENEVLDIGTPGRYQKINQLIGQGNH